MQISMGGARRRPGANTAGAKDESLLVQTLTLLRVFFLFFFFIAFKKKKNTAVVCLCVVGSKSLHDVKTLKKKEKKSHVNHF